MSEKIAMQPEGTVAPETLRLRAFALLLVASAMTGVAIGVSPRFDFVWVLFGVPPYVMWVVSDLCARRVVGSAFWIQLLVALLPLWGLLGYLVWSRRLLGVLQYVLFVTAVMLPGALLGVLTDAIVRATSGGG